MNAVAEFERDLLIERTKSGLARAKAEGTHLGRKYSLTADQHEEIRKKLAVGQSARSLAVEYETSRQTVMRIRDTS